MSEIDLLFDQAKAATDNNVFNETCERIVALARSDPDSFAAAIARRSQLVAELDDARLRVAASNAALAGALLCFASPQSPEGTTRPQFAGGPSTEIALAATHITRHARDIIPIPDDDPEKELESSHVDPRFDSYPSIFTSAVAHIQNAAFFLLDAVDSYAALASDPPEIETFPPIPFPKIWVEMSHLAPFMRFVDTTEKPNRLGRQLDVLGIALAEIEQGNVWDIYAPFQFDNEPEFFFLAARVTPQGVVDCDPSLGLAKQGFRELMKLSIGAVHLITARNAVVEDVPIPRHQRKRMVAASPSKLAPRLYFVNLQRSGERAASMLTESREYHVRWLVRGHWRHVVGGRRFCTCCDPPRIASWVEPYIKGPVGAPWKGRQVRRATPS